MKKIFILSLMMLVYANVFSQTATQVIAAMGPGVNIGNVWDNGQKPATFASVKPIIDRYKAEGMTNIRIPVSWIESVNGSTLATSSGVLNTSNPRFPELISTIDYCLDQGLYVTLNTHHEHWLKDNYDGSAYYNNIFYTLWYNIATYFKDYPSTLVFEILNEPEGAMGQWGEAVSPLDGNAIALTRQIMEVGYSAIRATGGDNSTRVVMVSPNGQGNDSQIEEVFPNMSHLPGDGNDPYLAMHVHSYDPWDFCGQTGSNINYPGAARIIADITTCKSHADNNLGGIPIHYGEFGVGRISNQAERAAQVVLDYYRIFAETAIENNMAFSVWDDRGWFGLINDAGTTFSHNIVPVMMSNIDHSVSPPPPPAPTEPAAVPGTIEAENYTNQFGLTFTAANLGYVDPGDWVEYTINVASAGTYTFEFLAASAVGTGSCYITIDGGASLGTFNADNTGDWGTYTTQSMDVVLPAGEHTLRLNFTASAFNLDKITVTSNQATTYASIPGIIQAENMDAQDGIIATETTIGYLDAGDYFAYNVNVASAGTYKMTFNVASAVGTGAVNILVDGNQVGTFNAPNTGGWAVYADAEVTVDLPAGEHVLRFNVTASAFNIDYMVFENSAPTSNSVAFNPPTIVESGDTYTVEVNYSSTQTNEVQVAFLGPNWTWITGGVVTVSAGSGVATVDINIPAVTAAASNYTWQTEIRPVGSTWEERFDVDDLINVQVASLKSASFRISDSEKNDELLIYPSPVSEVLYFKGIEDFKTVDIINSSGQLIRSVVIDNAADFSIDIKDLKSGIFFVKLVNAVETKTKKIIKK